MQVKTILNHVHEIKGFVYGQVQLVRSEEEGDASIEVEIRPRKNSRPLCSVCEGPGPVYDHLGSRRFDFVPVWGMAVVLIYCMRRVDCARCGVKVERVPWAMGKSPVTRSLAIFLADWARLLSWRQVAKRFGFCWGQVYESVKMVVEWGLTHRDLSGIRAIGIDEIHLGHGHRFLTVVYQLCGDKRRLLHIGRNRDAQALEGFFTQMGSDWCQGIAYVCSDMWKAYLKVIQERLPGVVHILDRFHIVKLLNEAVDKVRREESSALRAQGVELLKGMRYTFLKRPENLTDRQRESLQGVLNKLHLRTVRAYLWKQKFQLFWEYTSPYWAQRYLHKWCSGAMKSRLKPIKRFVQTVRRHEALILNWFRAKKAFSGGAVEAMNRNVNLITRRSYGFRSFEVLQVALFHTLGDLPQPKNTHRF